MPLEWESYVMIAHVLGECSEGRHSRGAEVADTCLIH